MTDPVLPPILYYSQDVAEQRRHDDTIAPGLLSDTWPGVYRAGDDGWSAVNELPADARRLVVGGPRYDRQCPACPTDLDSTTTGRWVCGECGWTDDPDRVPQLLDELDQLRAEAAFDAADTVSVTQERPETGDLADRIRAAAIEGVHPSRGPLISVAAVLTLLDGHLAAGDELAAVAGALISHIAATGGVPSRASGLWSRLERAAKSWRSQR